MTICRHCGSGGAHHPGCKRPHNTPLTDRQLAILTWIYEHARDKGYQPEYRDISDHFGMATQTGVVSHIAALQRKGYVKVTRHRTRSLVLLRKPDGTPFTGFAEKLSKTAQECA